FKLYLNDINYYKNYDKNIIKKYNKLFWEYIPKSLYLLHIDYPGNILDTLKFTRCALAKLPYLMNISISQLYSNMNIRHKNIKPLFIKLGENIIQSRKIQTISIDDISISNIDSFLNCIEWMNTYFVNQYIYFHPSLAKLNV